MHPPVKWREMMRSQTGHRINGSITLHFWTFDVGQEKKNYQSG